MDTQSILTIIQSQSAALRSYGVNRIGLFGSAVRGEMTDKSDIDVLVEFQKDKETFHNFMDTAFLLDDTFKNRKVDVVTPGGLSPLIKPLIERDIRYVQIS